MSGIPTHGLWYHFLHCWHLTMWLKAYEGRRHTHHKAILIVSTWAITNWLRCFPWIVGNGLIISVRNISLKCFLIFHCRYRSVVGSWLNAKAKQNAIANNPQSDPPRCCCTGAIVALKSFNSCLYKSANCVSSSLLVRPFVIESKRVTSPFELILEQTQCNCPS